MALRSVVPDLLHIDKHTLTILNVLGLGSSGVVVKGIWKHSSEDSIPVAIKMMSNITEERLEAVRREFVIMTSLSHEHLCKVFGGCLVSDTELWIVMELFEDGNLYECLSKFILPIEDQLRLACQATTALHVLHQCNPPVLHRDIKSLNFLYNRARNFLVLSDLGLAKEKYKLTSKTKTVGTERWAAPEVLGKRKEWSESADVYSLGMVFFELAVGRLPFEEYTTTDEVVRKVKRGCKPTLPPNFNKAFGMILHRCWKKNPKMRPSTGELLQWLQHLNDVGRLPKSFPMKRALSISCFTHAI